LLDALGASAVARALRGDADSRVVVVAITAGRDAVAISVEQRVDAFSVLAPLVVGTIAGAVEATTFFGSGAGRGGLSRCAHCRLAGAAILTGISAARAHARYHRQVVDPADDLTTDERRYYQQPRAHRLLARAPGKAAISSWVLHLA
jgi:hypothetical protein